MNPAHMFRAFLALVVASLLATPATSLPGPGKLPAGPATAYSRNFTQSSLLFTENRGQVADVQGRPRPEIRFTAQSRGTRVFLTATGIHYQFSKVEYAEAGRRARAFSREDELDPGNPEQISIHRFSLTLEGANPAAHIRKEARNAYTENFYLAQCPQGITGVPTYGRVVYEDVYPGIDWVVYGQGDGMKYDFVVHPGADPGRIRLKVSDAESVRITEEGELLMTTSLGEVREEAPVSYCDGKEVATQFVPSDDGIGFALGSYDPSRELVIDPSVVWATNYGGGAGDHSLECATDKDNNVYMVCVAASSGLAFGGFQNVRNNPFDALLVKFDSLGNRIWATYYGGDASEETFSCSADNNGNVYIAGKSYSDNGISANGFQPSRLGSAPTAYLAKFSSAGTRQWATYYGGADGSDARSCVADRLGNVYLAGWTRSASNIASGGFQNTLAGEDDAFLAKFSSTGARLWATYYGGAGTDNSYACRVDDSNNVYLVGHTNSGSGIAAGGFQNSLGDSTDAFLVKFSPAGARIWGTYYGGASSDFGRSCAVDQNGNVYLAGSAGSLTNLASGGFQLTHSGMADAFLAKFDRSGARLWSTYYGGAGYDYGLSCAADANGMVYLAGNTSSTSGIAASGFQDKYGGGNTDLFLVKFDSAGSRIWGSYYGGHSHDHGQGSVCAIDGSGFVYLTGQTGSDSGMSVNGFQKVNNGNFDAFLTKIDPSLSGVGIAPVTHHSWPGSLSIYPNPANNHFSLDGTLDPAHAGKTLRIELINYLGQQVYKADLRLKGSHFSTAIPVSGSIANGLYQLRVSAPGLQTVRPVAVQR